MTSPRIFTISLRLGAAALLSASALAGCSTVSSISPFSSSVPYSQDIKPTVPQPAQVDIPAFKPVPPAPPQPKPAEPSPAPEAPAAPAPAAAAPPVAPPPPPAPPTPAAPPPAPQSSAPEAAPAPAVAAATAPAAGEPKAEPAKTADAGASGEADTDSGPQLPAEHRQVNDNGTYRNLAQVPPRPVNLPTFADARSLESSLEADTSKAKTNSPESPNAPPVDTAPDRVASAGDASQMTKTPAVIASGAIARPEDKSPCLGNDAAIGDLATTIHFEPGSSAMTSSSLETLAEAMPTVRGAKGTIRVFGHGDTDANAQQSAGRFDLAAARAGAVAQALAGFGIAVPKIAVGVACNDAATAGASVQLYAES